MYGADAGFSCDGERQKATPVVCRNDEEEEQQCSSANGVGERGGEAVHCGSGRKLPSIAYSYVTDTYAVSRGRGTKNTDYRMTKLL